MKTADVIVIGGGIAGISAAAELAEDMTVLVLEAESQLGYHATGRSAAIFIRNYGNETLRALNAISASFLQTPNGVSDQSLLSPRGEMLVATGKELDALYAYISGSIGLEELTPAQAVELVPILRKDAIAGAIIEWDAQDIDVDRMLAGYVRLLKLRGGAVETNAPVTGLKRISGVWAVQTDGQSFQAPIVINAGGAWAEAIARMAKATDIRLLPMRRSAALLPAPLGHEIRKWPLFASATEQWYAKPEAGKLMVSPADEDPVDPHDAWVDDMVLAEGLHRYEQAVSTPVTRVETSWAGLRTFSTDRTPVVGFDPTAEGFYWLAGQGGYGVQTAPALARLTAALICNSNPGLQPDIVQALDPGRFNP
ncbi:FAD-binding oxidoreductase [Ruegeria sp. EL01]|uniref:NAD(P)/FAD-dependent oxidoreductase n=1 Tax=Ruegeria sp. EL01 TaxID=2107578 RepID=UPI000EA833F5|nr:FAD-dependent oxidoreductase [Ruegeria sp. EL01]